MESGASIGAEVYSIAMLMREARFTPALLLATDLDEAVLDKARTGVYLPSQVQGMDPKYLEKYFTATGSGSWSISEAIKNMVVFKQHDLLKDPYDRGFDLILCRNVFIYFTSDTQKRLISNFVNALNPPGIYRGISRADHGSREFRTGQGELLYLPEINVRRVIL